MIDFHSHILPGIDDGSSSVEESLLMLEKLCSQQVDTVVATSHFYATRRSPAEYLNRREQAWSQLKKHLPQDAPKILLGAEVLFFPGISRMEELSGLCVEGTDLLLLEMPFTTWTDYMIREVKDLACTGRYTILLAHIERYFSRQHLSVWDDFLDLGILMQANCDYFLPFRTRRKALKLLKEGRIHLLGSDCHNTTTRAPRMDEAAENIRRALGERALMDMDALGRQVLAGAL